MRVISKDHTFVFSVIQVLIDSLRAETGDEELGQNYVNTCFFQLDEYSDFIRVLTNLTLELNTDTLDKQSSSRNASILNSLF